jgi:hypothetical protein
MARLFTSNGSQLGSHPAEKTKKPDPSGEEPGSDVL